MIREFRIAVPGIKRKTILHAGDFHLNCTDALSTDEERKQAAGSSAEWEDIRKEFALAAGEPYGEEQMRPPEEHFRRVLDEARGGCDALILTGDVFDSVTPANLRFFDSALSDAGFPLMTVCGNHEDRDAIPSGHAISPAAEPVQILRLGGLTAVGIDDSRREITAEQLDALSGLIGSENKILLVMHVPVMTDADRASGSADDYFFLDFHGCPGENLKFIDLVRRNAEKFAAVLTGHTHRHAVGAIAPGVTQYTVSQGIAGNLNRYIIGE